MVSHEQCSPVARSVIGAILTFAGLGLQAFGQPSGKKFYPDDPLLREPAPSEDRIPA